MTRTKDTENFPVGSWLVAPHLRPVVHAYYRFARHADDISDDPHLAGEEKVRLLEALDAQLVGGEGDGPAAQVRDVLAKTDVPIAHCRDLLLAFKRDSVKPRTQDWAQLMDYCRYSASPVGRFLLDLHGESQSTWQAGDALCSALQVLNHLQDAQDDFIQLDRVYLPQDLLSAAGVTVEDIRLPQSSPGIAKVIGQMLDLTVPLVELAKTLPDQVKDGGLRRETSIIVVVAERLLNLLRRQDPLAQRVQLSKTAFAMAAFAGLGRTFFPRTIR